MLSNDPPVHFARVREILQGATFEPRPNSRASSILRALFTGETDTEISPRGFVVRFAGGGTIPYVSEAAPATIHALLARAQICPQGQALAFRLEDEDSYALAGLPDAARWVWVMPGEDVVLVSLRRPTSAGPPPAEPPPLPLPSKLKKLYAHLAQPLACPHCARASSVYRATQETWVCGGPRCGQSFSPPHRVRALAELRDDAGGTVRETTARAKIYR
ncbi:hypothetical protein SAMN02745121_00962 [Nannocystis exedens]|uniref:Uncharacterized protein n=1 Tax=Nannocystis exedens TaxID=54 RepID=A0A1I1U468_9BACT|nr:hypothetical protein [Nannocystis exedens]PCC71421.1 hypothetical protein NAEX_04498 [Nannocystis exedens]SFD65636.1 hypothetical protein SAMN02745121_00962 [Nannocystis exedens]